jgi:hypothetical protein
MSDDLFQKAGDESRRHATTGGVVKRQTEIPGTAIPELELVAEKLRQSNVKVARLALEKKLATKEGETIRLMMRELVEQLIHQGMLRKPDEDEGQATIYRYKSPDVQGGPDKPRSIYYGTKWDLGVTDGAADEGDK